jgi:hypothetical protein
MVVIAVLYLVLLWLLFSKLELVRLGWVTGTIASLFGLMILGVHGAVQLSDAIRRGDRTRRRNHSECHRPGGRDPGQAKRSGEGRRGPVPDRPSAFPVQSHAGRGGASGVKQQAQQLKANYEQASATVQGLVTQLAYNTKRLNDMQSLARSQATSEFREQDVQVQQETVAAQLQAAKAAQMSAKLAADSEINGVNTSVIQNQANLDNAKWEFEQTIIELRRTATSRLWLWRWATTPSPCAARCPSLSPMTSR